MNSVNRADQKHPIRFNYGVVSLVRNPDEANIVVFLHPFLWQDRGEEIGCVSQNKMVRLVAIGQLRYAPRTKRPADQYNRSRALQLDGELKFMIERNLGGALAQIRHGQNDQNSQRKLA